MVASITTTLLMEGRGEAGLMMSGGPFVIRKLIAWLPVFVLASEIACRKDPAPLSLVLLTVKVVAPSLDSGLTSRNISRNNSGFRVLEQINLPKTGTGGM